MSGEPGEDDEPICGDGRMQGRGLAEQQARAMAQRIADAKEAGAQLDMFAVPPSPEDPETEVDERRGPGRPKGARNKSKSPMRALLAARGYRQPEDVLTELAGLHSRESLDEQAMRRAERLLAWAKAGAADGGTVTTGQRVGLALQFLGMMKSASDSLLPYGLAKMSGDDAGAAPATFVVLPGGRGAPDPAESARTIDHRPAMAPPPLPGEADEVPRAGVNHAKGR